MASTRNAADMPASDKTPPPQKSLFKHSFAGVAAGGISTAILYPLDLVKTRYQIHENSPRAFRSLGQAFASIVKSDAGGSRYNLRALYQGMSPALYGTTLSWGLYFLFYEHAKSFYAEQTVLPAWAGHFASGIQAGAMCVPLTNPIWLVKVRMQVQATHPSQVPYKNVANALQRIVAEEGVAALYKGVVPALFLTTHAYEWLKTEYNDHIGTPLEGVRGFYKGLTPNLIKVLPTGALIFAVYEYVYQLLDGLK
ncbi:hypothetical protein DYB26_006600 [Aphanomyces astaci]|uniref:Mitochondrial folate transporter/carrier n=1 Tax=Aphanomyces astaci TaxID=112090 RepID=A0A397EI18_APHAT|nr:hypothetical protein DYB38_004027 [Aphanomyces astaci]RHY91829.1 hypothetical protein DYB31_013228 [Aphanomyces astaci]RHY93118.1 hypothetical protein DYB26_006600 [Aphanomyces astaci]